ncbi:MAG: hypothetical protein JEY97_11215 [Bacteroidales bacterium]|nr:hypothetical protein [Bacteroidales bacterium]
MTKEKKPISKPKEVSKKVTKINLGRETKAWQPFTDETTTPPTKGSKDKKKANSDN